MVADEYEVIRQALHIFDESRLSFPVKPSDVKNYALATHAAVGGKNILNCMFNSGVTRFQAKLIDSYIIRHADEIADGMLRDHIADVYGVWLERMR